MTLRRLGGCQSRPHLVKLLLLALVAGWGQTAAAQPPRPETKGGFQPHLPPVPQKAPRSPEQVASFIDSLGTNDALFEVVVGQGRMLVLKENLAVPGKPRPLVAVGDPTVLDFEVVGSRQIRVIGKRFGVTDLVITTADSQNYSFEVQVVADLPVLRSHLKALFPDASLKLAQIRDHFVVEGQARDQVQIAHIIESVRAYLESVQVSQRVSSQQAAPTSPTGTGQPTPARPMPGTGETPPMPPQGEAQPEQAARPTSQVTIPAARIINLLRVLGPQQVLLKVRVAELNRTAMREIGADLIFANANSVFGTKIGGSTIAANSLFGPRGLSINPDSTFGTADNITTVFGVFEPNFEFLLRALRQNKLLKILAEPNLVAMNGQEANFLAGGQVAIPVPQSGAGGGPATITIQYKDFGVSLGFVPYVLDGDVIRLSVDPEVSAPDQTLGLVIAGFSTPGFNTRKAHTTVELHEGQTLAIAGLLAVTLEGSTSRIPGLGDLPILGPFFSNTSSGRTEKELIILVTPYLVESMDACRVPPMPGDEVNAPNDLEFYFMNRLEGRTGKDFRATTEYDDPLHILKLLKLESKYVCGQHGFSP